MQFLYKSDKILLFGKYVNTKLLADLDLLSNALALQMAGEGAGGAAPPHLKSMDKDQNTLAS